MVRTSFVCTEAVRSKTILFSRGVLCGTYLPEKCSYCFTNVGTGGLGEDVATRLRCSRCKISCYCSQACQKADWAMHKTECSTMVPLLGAIDRVHGLSPGALGDAILTARLLRARAARKKEGASDSSAEGRKLVAAPLILQKEGVAEVLVSSLDDVDKLVLDERIYDTPGTTEKYQKLAKALIAHGAKILPDGTSTDEICDILAKFQCNNFSIVDDLFISVGAGIYPVGALLNHSCLSNCVLSYVGKTHVQVIRALVDLKPGDEICHSYCETGNPRWIRQKKLREDYGFGCECERCESPKWQEV